MAASVETSRLALRAEQAAWLDFVRAAPRSFLTDFGITSAPVADGVALCCTRVPAPILNRAFAFGLDTPITEPDLDRALAFFASHGAEGVAVQIAPPTSPEREVAGWLTARGFSPQDRRVQMIRDTSPVPSTATSLRVGLVPPNEAEAFGRVCVGCFEMPDDAWPGVAALVGQPDWRCFGSWRGDDLVGTGALFLHGDVGWIGFASTLPAARGGGGQSTLMRLRIETARELGCRHVVTETHDDLPAHPNPSLRNMRRAGFEEVLWEDVWQR